MLGVSAELVLYTDDEGYVAAVRPEQTVDGFPSGVNVSSWWEEIDNIVGRVEGGWLGAVGPEALRKVLESCAAVGNRLLPALRRLAGEQSALRAVAEVLEVLEKPTGSPADHEQELAEILARHGFPHAGLGPACA